jgi:hypothetical protein
VDAIDAYDRYLINLPRSSDEVVTKRIWYLKQIHHNGTPSSELPLPMKDIDLHSEVDFVEYLDVDNDIRVASV